jgi:hypothetical protein
MNLAVLRQPVPIQEQVSQALISGHEGNVTGAGQFSVASTGTLAFIPALPPSYPLTRLVRLDRRGSVTDLPLIPRSYGGALRVSPDGRTLVTSVISVTEMRLWTIDVARGTTTPITAEGESDWPV